MNHNGALKKPEVVKGYELSSTSGKITLYRTASGYSAVIRFMERS